ncbi:MAG TPA: hypothetical protein VE801_10985 [Xanthobacteraceae bacterium]|nr:hypothetical protein [Xanthobacteraceae bacterium]
MPRRRRKLLGCLALVFGLAAAGPAAAHGFGQRYDLPLPLSFYIWGAGATVALSFVGFALFLRAEHGLLTWHIDWRAKGRPAAALAAVARALASGMLLVVIVAGLFGNQDPIRNIAPVMIWIIGWVGLAFLSVLLGDVWRLVNPWNAIFAFAELCCRRVCADAVLGFARRYPQWLAAWPAFLLLMAFAWMELVWSGRNDPAALAVALAAYSALTFCGMGLFGRQTWLAQGEMFTLVFGTFARFGPLAAIPQGIRLRMPAAGLLTDQPATFSMVALVVALLATVTFDGLLETPLWARIDLAVLDWASEPSFGTVPILREDQMVRLVRSVALVAFILLFLAAYAVVCRLTSAAVGKHVAPTGGVLRSFVLTLVPIAIAYHVAHYFSLFFLGGQYVIPLISDPLGRGWDLFGTAHYQVDIGLVTPRLQWSVAVVAVVLGHVCAIYLSHVTALRLFADRRAALRSQIPMVALMVIYTMLSLWILSQPIVETGVR